MTTQTESETADLAILDFVPRCEVQELHRKVWVTCTNPAAWVGTAPCGHGSFFCETHHHDQSLFTCGTCECTDLHLNTYRWVQL